MKFPVIGGAIVVVGAVVVELFWALRVALRSRPSIPRPVHRER